MADNAAAVEDDLSLPRAAVNKMIKEMIPMIRVSNDARELVLNCCTEFIHLIASEANEICNKQTKKTISPEHVIQALESLGFHDYVKDVEGVYQQFKKQAQTRKKNNKMKNQGISEEELLRQQQALIAKARAEQAQEEWMQMQQQQYSQQLALQQQQQQQQQQQLQQQQQPMNSTQGNTTPQQLNDAQNQNITLQHSVQSPMTATQQEPMLSAQQQQQQQQMTGVHLGNQVHQGHLGALPEHTQMNSPINPNVNTPMASPLTGNAPPNPPIKPGTVLPGNGSLLHTVAPTLGVDTVQKTVVSQNVVVGHTLETIKVISTSADQPSIPMDVTECVASSLGKT